MLRRIALTVLLVGPSLVSAQSIGHAIELFDQFKYNEAKIEFQELARRDVNAAIPVYYLGRIASVELDEDVAIDDFERAVRLDETKALYHSWLGNAVCDKTVHSRIFRQPFMAKRVMREWMRAVELDPGINDTRLSLVQFYVSVPGFMGGGLGRARHEAAELTGRSPFHAALARAYIAEAEKNPAREEEAYTQSVAAAPDSILGYVLLSESYVRHGKIADAFHAIDSYAIRNPDDPWIAFDVGRISAATGQRLETGMKELQKFLGNPPVNATPRIMAEAQYRLGQIAERQGAKLDARRYYAAARQINPNVEVVKNLRFLTCR